MILTLRELNECLEACRLHKNPHPHLISDIKETMSKMLAHKPVIESVELPDDNPVAMFVKEIAGIYHKFVKQTERRR